MGRDSYAIQGKAGGQAAARDIRNTFEAIGILFEGAVVVQNLYVSEGNIQMNTHHPMDAGSATVQSVTATITRCRDGQALIVLDSEPFNGMEVRPHALRRLSENLTALAEMASRLPMGGKHWRPTKVEIGGAEDAAKAQETSLPSMEGSKEFDEMVKTLARNFVREPVNYRPQKDSGRQKVDYTIKPRGTHEDD